MDHREEFVDVRGKRTQILIGGTGAPLLYLHSAGGEVAWLPFFEKLAAHHTVYVPAHPGFSESTGLEQIDSMEDLVFHYTDLIDQLGIDKPSVVGLSLGGWLAAEFATRYSERIGSMVLIAAVGLRVKGEEVADIFSATPKETRHLVFHESESDLARTFIPDDAPPEALANNLKARQATARLGWNPYLHNRKLAGRLYRVKTDTLILWGDSDRLISDAHGRAYQQGIDGAKLVVIKEAGHALPFERPDETADHIINFLN